MRKSRFTEAQIIGMLKGQESGMPTAKVSRRHISEEWSKCSGSESVEKRADKPIRL